MSPQLPDIQTTVDTRQVSINNVGVTGIRIPLRLLRPAGASTMDTVGEFEMSVHLPADVKGTHMSRFSEVLNEHVDKDGVFSSDDLQKLVSELAVRLTARHARITLKADYFIEQPAPVSHRRGIAPITAILSVETTDGDVRVWTGIEMHGKTCCPCSREISDFDSATGRGKGAHAQRSLISIIVEHSRQSVVWFEDLVSVCWKSFSAPVYPVLKRVDERHVTMHAYGNPKFVEDVIRDVVVNLGHDIPETIAYRVRVQNAESIHYHDAFAEVVGVL